LGNQGFFNMKLTNLIFDLDGTVIDTLVDLHRAISDTLEAFGFSRITMATTRGLLGGGAKEFVRGALKDHAKDEAFFETFFSAYMTRYRAYQVEQSSPYPGMVDVLTWCRSVGIRLFIFSNKPHALTVELIDHRLPHMFTGVHGHKPHTKPKPDRTMYDVFANEHGIASSESIFIGDSEFDIEMGRVLGMPTIAVAYGYVDKPILTACHPDYLVDDVTQLHKLLQDLKLKRG